MTVAREGERVVEDCDDINKPNEVAYGFGREFRLFTYWIVLILFFFFCILFSIYYLLYLDVISFLISAILVTFLIIAFSYSPALGSRFGHELREELISLEIRIQG